MGVCSRLETFDLVETVFLGARAMRRNHWLKGALLAPIGLILAAAGCTGSEVLAPKSNSFVVEVEVINTETRFEVNNFQINQLEVRPTDPDADTALQVSGLGMLLRPFQMSYRNNPADQSEGPIPNGEYRVTLMRINPIRFNDLLDPPASAPSCAEYVRTWSYTDTVFVTDFGEEVTFRVRNGASNRIKLVVDGAAFLRAFQESWTCQDTGNGTWRLVSGSFNRIAFGRRAPEYLAFQ